MARPRRLPPDLATSLNNLGAMLSGLGRREEALAATGEAVEIYRRLAVARPDAFEPDLARSLWACGWVVEQNLEAHPRDEVLDGAESVSEAVRLMRSWRRDVPRSLLVRWSPPERRTGGYSIGSTAQWAAACALTRPADEPSTKREGCS